MTCADSWCPAGTKVCGSGQGLSTACEGLDDPSVGCADPSSCTTCPTPAGRLGICVSGACAVGACKGGYTACGGAGSPCFDLTADAANCGSCGHVCAAGLSCLLGVCTDTQLPSPCGPPAMVCNGVCTNIMFSVQQCGGCNTPCAPAPAGQTVTCVSGTCTYTPVPPPDPCPSGTTTCGGSSCVDLQTSFANCGACGNVCPHTAIHKIGVGGVNIDGDSTTLCLAGQCACPDNGGLECGNSGCICGIVDHSQAPTTIVSTNVTDFALQGGTLYYADASDGTINGIPAGGGAITQLAGFQITPVAIAADGANVVWANSGSNVIMAVPAGGGTATQLASTGLVTNLASDGTFVYYSEGGEVFKVAISGGSPVLLYASAGPAVVQGSLVQNTTTLFWLQNQTNPSLASLIQSIDKDGTPALYPPAGTAAGWLQATDSQLTYGNVQLLMEKGPVYDTGWEGITGMSLSDGTTTALWGVSSTYDGGPFLLDGSEIYFLPDDDQNGMAPSIARVSVTGSCYPATFADVYPRYLRGRIVADASYVYWRNDQGALSRQPK